MHNVNGAAGYGYGGFGGYGYGLGYGFGYGMCVLSFLSPCCASIFSYEKNS